MICKKNYLADILRVCEIKDLIWVMRFQSPLVYIWYSPQKSKYPLYIAGFRTAFVVYIQSLEMN